MCFLCSLVKHLFCFSCILNKTHLSKARILYQTSLAKLVKSYHNMGTKNWLQRLLIELMSKIKAQISRAGLKIEKLVHPACIFPWFPSHHAWDTHEKSLMQLLNKCWSYHLWENTALVVELNVFFLFFCRDHWRCPQRWRHWRSRSHCPSGRTLAAQPGARGLQEIGPDQASSGGTHPEGRAGVPQPL